MIRLHKHSEIDFEKWDRCVEESPNGKIYATSWYLSIIHHNWAGIIATRGGRYVAVAPVLSTVRKGVKMHVAPALAQQLGIFAVDESVYAEMLDTLVKYLQSEFGVFTYPLCVGNIPPSDGSLSFSRHPNFILPLLGNYPAIKSRYRRDRRFRKKTGDSLGVRVQRGAHPDTLIHLFTTHVVGKIEGGVAEKDVFRLSRICTEALDRNCGELVEAVDAQGVCIAAAMFLFFKDRIYYFLSASSAKGREQHAHTLILDYIIQANSSSGLTLDFEGSDVPGIADFFEGFGSKKEYFHTLEGGKALWMTYLKIRKWQKNFSWGYGAKQ
jgi:hypothetical protein